ncbi:endoribonuclease L-PSP [Caballeronia pedi]|uniref:Endoribonuclease L-PSP n=1 Tax=Caballeronia pedi TaxID=1777141 RepID=A0A158DBM9_9BURK|nr:endoribonuclease L-PSP [Caballeronia pedi]
MSQPTHTRIRMFNTKDTYPNQTLDNDLCQAVRAGNTVYVRGQIGTDFDGNLIGLGDPRAQAEQAMKNVKQLLEEAGSDLSHIVKTTTYLTDVRYREPVYREVGKWLKGVFPISTGTHRRRARSAGMADGDRRDRRDSRWLDVASGLKTQKEGT